MKKQSNAFDTVDQLLHSSNEWHCRLGTKTLLSESSSILCVKLAIHRRHNTITWLADLAGCNHCWTVAMGSILLLALSIPHLRPRPDERLIICLFLSTKAHPKVPYAKLTGCLVNAIFKVAGNSPDCGPSGQ